jgi:hypothetical protein
MHSRHAITLLGTGTFALLLLAPEGAQSRWRRFSRGPVYYQPYVPMYYAQPMSYPPVASYAPPSLTNRGTGRCPPWSGPPRPSPSGSTTTNSTEI